MRGRARQIGLVIGVVVLASALAGWQIVRPGGPPRERTLSGAVITQLDVAARTAEIEFIHPKTGDSVRLSGRVPPACEIQVNGLPATLAELRVGDMVDVGGTVQRRLLTYVVEAHWVSAARRAPASRPVGGP